MTPYQRGYRDGLLKAAEAADQQSQVDADRCKGASRSDVWGFALRATAAKDLAGPARTAAETPPSDPDPTSEEDHTLVLSDEAYAAFVEACTRPAQGPSEEALRVVRKARGVRSEPPVDPEAVMTDEKRRIRESRGDCERRLSVALAQVAAARECLEAIRDYPPPGGRVTKGSDGTLIPAEVVYDQFAYERMIGSYRAAARAGLAEMEKTK